MQSFARRVCVTERARARVTVQRCMCVRVRETRLHNCGLCSANTSEPHHSVPLSGTLLTVFIFNLKAEPRVNGKGCYISNACLWCSANHNALGQLANQSRLRLSEVGVLQKLTCLREVGHTGNKIMYCI